MLDYLFKIPDLYLFFILIILSISFSIACIFLVTYFIPLSIRRKDNTILGTVSSIISLIYGVLAGLMALYLINNISYTTDAVQREASAIANIHRDSQWLKEPAHSNIKKQIRNYLVHVIQVEWPLMENGQEINNEGEKIIEEMDKGLRTDQVIGGNQSLILQEMLQEIKTLYNAREQRIQMSYESLNIEIWLVILIGTILTIAINFLFGMNIYLHVAVVCAVALMTSSMLFLLLALDRPFQGEFVIEPSAFRSILVLMDKTL